MIDISIIPMKIIVLCINFSSYFLISLTKITLVPKNARSEENITNVPIVSEVTLT